MLCPVAARTELADREFLTHLRGLHSGAAACASDAPIAPGVTLTAGEARTLFDAQAESRHLDYAARTLRGLGQGYYTIGSSGHEGNAVVGALTRHTDPALDRKSVV